MARPKKNGTTSTALVNWESRMHELATTATKTVANVASNKMLTVRAGVLTFNGAPIKDNMLDVVVLDFHNEHVYYVEKFDPDNPTNPICWAKGRTEDMAPSDEVTEKQSEVCKDCPKFEWGSDPGGTRGKACKQIIRLAMITATDLEGDIAEAEIAQMRLPVTSVASWAAYVRSLANVVKRHPTGVITKLHVVPDPKTQFKVTFRHEGNISPEYMGDVMALHDRVGDELNNFTYGKYEAVERAPARTARSSKYTATRKPAAVARKGK